MFIDVNCKNSSTGKIVYDLYTVCRKKGHEAAISYGRGSEIDEVNVFKFGIDLETHFHAMMTRLSGLTGYFSFFSTRRLLKCMGEFKPDVVHIHELHAYFVNIAPVISYLKKNNIKTIWTFHCEFMYTGKCGHAFECEGWKNECGNCPQVKGYPSSLFFDFTKEMFQQKKRLFNEFYNLTIITPSKWLADRVKQSFLGDRVIRVIHNGIDTNNIFYPRSFEKLKKKHNITDEKIVLSVAPDIMSEQKGGRWVLRLAERLQNQRIKFILIGVKDLNEHFGNNVIALGRIENQKELAEYYSMAEVFVICSKRENFPTTCIEALSCGTPICGFDAGGIKETAPEGYGVFVQYGDIVALSNTILRSLDIASKLSKECAAFGKQTFSKETMFKEYMNLYFC